jgi:DNA processing protein
MDIICSYLRKNGFQPANCPEQIDKFQKDLTEHDLQIVSILNPDYCPKFRILAEPPLVLYYQGELSSLLETQLLTVVGSRSAGLYAQQLLKKVLEPLCRLGLGVVSGLALGVDTLGHQTAADSQALNIAVIGSGLDRSSFYPKENWRLMQQILEQGGLILSEYTPGTPPNNYHFPRRNRLLAALSELTWVVQAGLKSGSLITATAAQELGKTVATTPGSVLEPELAGNLKLLKDGANLVSEPEDVLQILGLSQHPKIQAPTEPSFGSPEEKLIWQHLSLVPQPAEELAKQTGLNINQLGSLLTMLELQNLAICTGDNLWLRG